MACARPAATPTHIFRPIGDKQLPCWTQAWEDRPTQVLTVAHGGERWYDIQPILPRNLIRWNQVYRIQIYTIRIRVHVLLYSTPLYPGFIFSSTLLYSRVHVVLYFTLFHGSCSSLLHSIPGFMNSSTLFQGSCFTLLYSRVHVLLYSALSRVYVLLYSIPGFMFSSSLF